MNRDEMLKALTAMDFYAVDMALYLTRIRTIPRHWHGTTLS